MKTLLTALAFGAAAVAPAVAHAADASVAYGDLDLSTPAGKAELAARINKAAATVCATAPITGTRIAPSADRTCSTDVRAQISARLDSRLNKRASSTELASRNK